MEFPIVHRIQHDNTVQGLPWVAPSPSLTCYYFLRDAQLFALNIKTQVQCLLEAEVKDFLLCCGCEGRGPCIAYVTTGNEIKLALLSGTKLVSSCTLRICNFQGDGFQLVCSTTRGLVLEHMGHLVAVSLEGVDVCRTLQPLWQTQLGSTPLLFQTDPDHVYTLTSACEIVSYSLSTGCRGDTWDIGKRNPFAVRCFAPLLSEHFQYMVLLCDRELAALCTHSSKQRVAAFSKLQCTKRWQHLMEVPPGLHVLVNQGNHLVLCWGPGEGLRQLATIKINHGDVVCTSRLNMSARFTVIHDNRHQPCWNIPVLLQFEDRLVALCLGVTQQMLLHEVMNRHGMHAAGSLSQLNSWSGDMTVDVLQQGIRHRQLDTIAFFLQPKGDVLETIVSSHMKDQVLDQVLQDLLETVQENSSQLTSRHFSQQLLQQMLHFVVRLLCAVESDDQENRLTVLSSKLAASRQHLPKHTTAPSPGTLVKPPEAVSNVTDTQVTKLSQNLLNCAIVEGHAPKAQCQMCETKKITLADLRSMGRHLTLHKLSAGEDISSLISNMGLSPLDEMNNLLLSCRDEHIRSLLFKALGDASVPNDVLLRLDRLEIAYPCHKSHVQATTSSETVAEIVRTGYSRLAPCWLQHWTTEEDSRILADSLHRKPEDTNHPVSKTYWMHMLENAHLDTVLTSLPQYVDRGLLVNLGASCSPMWHVYKMLLCALVRYGVFSEETLEDFGDVLALLGEANHPLDALFCSSVSVSPGELIHRLLHHCLQHSLSAFLYFLTCEIRCDVRPQCHLCNIPVVSALLSHVLWIKQPEDKGTSMRACRALVRAIHGRPGYSSDLDFAALLNDQHLLHSLCLATVHRVSIYGLLGGPWNAMRLFIWQNIRASDKDANCMALPHFSHATLVESCGLKEKLCLTYYFLRGRPCFAYLKYVTQHLVGQHATSNKRLKTTLKVALRTAHLHFEDSLVVASCVTFLELTGIDTIALRLDVQCARLLLEDRESSPEKNIGELLEEVQQNSLKAGQMLRLLSDTVLRDLQEHADSGAELFLGLLLWQFAVHHGLEPPLTMLQWSAQNNDWLGFLFWMQLFQLPKVQALAAIMQFEDSCLREHLGKALLEVSSLRDTDDSGAVPMRNLRTSLYSRIGLQSVERLSPVAAESLSEGDAASVYSGDSMDAALLEDTVALYKRDLLSLLLESSSPWSLEYLLSAAVQIWSPIPCVVAACCSDVPLVSCFTLWLVTSGRRKSMEQLSFKEHTLHELMTAMQDAIHDGRLHNLLLGLHIFQPESPLVSLVEFLVAFHLERKGYHAPCSLNQFRDAMVTCSQRSGATGLSSVQWVTSASVTLLGTFLSVCASWQDQCSLLRCCLQAGLQKLQGAPDFAMLMNLLDICQGQDFGITPSELFFGENPAELLECAVHFLNHSRHFSQATAVAKFAGFPLADVVLEQMELKFGDYAESSNKDGEEVQWDHFCEECNRCFQEARLEAQQAFNFFKERASLVKSYYDKYKIMQFASQWLDQMRCTPDELGSHRLDVWLFRIKAEKEKISNIIPFDKVDCKALILSPSTTPTPTFTLEDAEELQALERLTNQLLLNELFCQATFLVSAFGHATLDYHVLTTCIQLAQGDIQPSNIDPMVMQRAKQMKASMPFRRQSTVTILNPAEHKVPQVRDTTNYALECIIELCGASGSAASLCNRVLVALKSAIALSRPYQEVAGEMHTISLLDQLLHCVDGFALAKDVIAVYNIPQADVIRLLFDKAMAAIGKQASSSDVHKDMLENFESMLQLCEDPADLGNLLLGARNVNLRALDGDSKGLLAEVELCIRAHDCFSVACCMEGISRTLHRCRRLTPCLVANQEFPFLVRLLTGIRRYSEMSYIFDVLHDHDKFELLFQRGMEKVPYLRVALLDYLKHRSSANPDMYTMLTLNFNMHREIAEILESSAMKKIKTLGNDGALTWCREELEILEDAIQDLADAAESYIKAECILRAQACTRKAQLVALQLRYFSRKIALINLDPSQALVLLTNLPKFFEAQLVSEAYCLQQSWWSGAVFNRVVEAGDWEYMKDMTAAGCELTPLHLEDIAHRYNKQCTGLVQCEAMKRLVEAVPCVKTRFDIAQRLGFLRIAERTLSSQAYLRDLCSTFINSHSSVL